MEVHIIIGIIGKKHEAWEELMNQSLADNISIIVEDEKTPSELLTECIYEDFVKAR
jgi:hypothetical protein